MFHSTMQEALDRDRPTENGEDIGPDWYRAADLVRSVEISAKPEFYVDSDGDLVIADGYGERVNGIGSNFLTQSDLRKLLRACEEVQEQ